MFDALLLRVGGRLRHSDVPVPVITGTGADPRPRVRVDPSQTGFWEGRMFRVMHEFDIASGQSQWLRFIAPVDVIIHARPISVASGNLRFALSTGGTAGGTWTDKTIFPVNSMGNRPTPLYTPLVQSSYGGTVTGSTERDIAVLETGDNKATSTQAAAEETGQGAGTYYAELRNTGNSNVRGVYQVIWEEWLPRSSEIA